MQNDADPWIAFHARSALQAIDPDRFQHLKAERPIE